MLNTRNFKSLVQVFLGVMTIISALVFASTISTSRAAAQTTSDVVFGLPTQVDHQAPWSTINAFSGVSCPSAGLCVAVDTAGHVITSTDPTGGSSTWDVSNLTQAGLALTGVSCPSVSLCIAVDANGDIITSTNPLGGPKAWNITGGILDSSFPAYVSCPSATFCVAVDANDKVAYSTDPTGGASAWSTYLTDYPGLAFDGISCATSTLCVGIDSSSEVVVSTDPTSPAQLGGSGPGGWYETTIDSGNVLSGVWCASTNLCLAVDRQGNIVSSTDPTGGSSTWSLASVDGTTPLLGVTCASTSLCAAVDSHGGILTSTSPNGGAGAWTTVTVDSANELTAVACPTVSLCVAVDNVGNALSTADPLGGMSSWAAVTVDDTNWLSGISCPSTSLCVGVDISGNVVLSTDPTSTTPNWTVSRVDLTNKLTAVSCPSVTLCVAVDDGDHIFTSTNPAGGATSWTTADESALITGGFYGVSCASQSACLAVGGGESGVITTDPTGGATAWSYVDVGPESVSTPTGPVGGGERITGVSCSLDLCVTTDDAGEIETAVHPFTNIGPNKCYDPTTGSNDLNGPCFSTATLSSGAIMEGVSCSSATFCAVVDDLGEVWTSTDPAGGASAWHAASIDSANFLNAVTCESASLCLAVDNVGNVFTSSNPAAGASTWAKTDVDGINNSLSGVSCASSSFCVLVDNIGNVIPGGVLAIPTITTITPDSSPLAGGGTATIVGTDLSGTSSVNFGSVAASNVDVISPTEITVTIPVATVPGLVEVTVTASGKTSAGSGFMYVTSGIPYTPVTPYRIADTRCSASPQPSFCAQENLPSANQSLSSPPAGGSITVQVTGTGSGPNTVPADAQSVVVTVTAIAGTAAHSGYLTAYPTGTNPPDASSLNYTPGVAIPNLVTATLGSGGAIDILSSSANVNIVVDVEGYYEPSTSTTTNKFTPLPVPVRVLDTRCEGALAGSSYCAGLNLPSANQLEAPGAGSYIEVEVAGLDNISLSATAISLVVTAAGPSSGGYLTVFPAGSSTTPPETSNVNFHANITSANSVTVELGSTGAIYVYNSASTPTNVIVDVNGYFSSSGDVLTPSSPVRICDTRSLSPGDVAGGISGQCNNSGTPLGPSSGPITVQVTGIAGITSTAKVVVANITVVSIAGSGYLTAWAAGATRPTTSNINWGKGQIMPNMVISTLSSSGQMEIYTSATANVIIDVVGWYS